MAAATGDGASGREQGNSVRELAGRPDPPPCNQKGVPGREQVEFASERENFDRGRVGKVRDEAEAMHIAHGAGEPFARWRRRRGRVPTIHRLQNAGPSVIDSD